MQSYTSLYHELLERRLFLDNLSLFMVAIRLYINWVSLSESHTSGGFSLYYLSYIFRMSLQTVI